MSEAVDLMEGPPPVPSVEELLRKLCHDVEDGELLDPIIANTALLIRVRVMLDAQTETRIA